MKQHIEQLEEQVKNLKRSNFLYKSIVENLPFGIQVFDQEGLSYTLNGAQKELLGLPDRDEGIGQFNVLEDPYAKATGADQKYKKVYRGETYRHEFEYDLGREENRWDTREDARTFEEYIFPIEEGGRVKFAVALLRDKTQERRAERELKESKEFLDVVFQSIQDGISVLNTDLSIRYVNPVMEQWYAGGVPLVGKKCHLCYHGSHTPCDPCPSLRAIRSGQAEFNVVPGYPDETSPVQWLELYSYPILDSGTGEVTGVVEFVRDITEGVRARQELASQKERLANIIEATDAGTWEWNVQTGQTIFNERWAHIVGYSLEELSPTSIDTWMAFAHPEDLERSNKLLQEHFRGERDYYECEARMRHKDGSWKWVLDRGKVISRTQDGQPLWMFGTHHDVTGRKQHEAEIEKLNEELTHLTDTLQSRNKELQTAEEELKASNDELLEINQHLEDQKDALERARKKAEESDRLKTAFLANMSHEIRTPMNSIMGFSQLLGENEYPREKQEKFLGIIHQRTHHLLRIINDIVDLSKIEAGQMTLESQKFSLKEDLEDLYRQYQDQIREDPEKQLELKMHPGLDHPDSWVYSDPTRFRQIMDNLLNNAIKFTSQGYVEFGYTLQDANTLLFYVKDTGVGIAPGDQARIFERFSQVSEGANRRYEGTGLGLTISRNLVELLGGHMWVESEKGKGSVFYFTLPYKRQESSQRMEEKRGEEEPRWPDKTLLLIEDDPASRAYMMEIFKPTGVNLLWSESGKEGLQLFRENAGIDLVLLDLKLPDISGLEVAQEIRTTHKKIPIIAQTAYAMSGDDHKSVQAGCNDYISKPIDRKELLDKIKQLLNPE